MLNLIKIATIYVPFPDSNRPLFFLRTMAPLLKLDTKQYRKRSVNCQIGFRAFVLQQLDLLISFIAFIDKEIISTLENIVIPNAVHDKYEKLYVNYL